MTKTSPLQWYHSSVKITLPDGPKKSEMNNSLPVLRSRIRMFAGLPNPDLSVRGTDPDRDPYIIKQK
jgi:hypothetical protein